MSVRMRVNRSHTGHRRSHHALKEPRLSKCAKCSAQHLRHRMCPECGDYRGREVVDVVAKTTARVKRREEKTKALMGEDNQEEEEPKVEKKKATSEKKDSKEEKSKAKKKETSKKD